MPATTTERQASLRDRISGCRLPLMVAPMFGLSDLRLVDAACAAGVAAAFPTPNCESSAQLEDWLNELEEKAGPGRGPVCPNVIVHRSIRRMERDLDVLRKHPPEMIVTSVGSPTPVIEAMAGTDTLVLSDVASIRHLHRALEAGVDGVVLLCAGAGGQTGWLNPIAFCRAARQVFDGPVALAGSMTDGAGIQAAMALGADIAYCGTRFIATSECSAPDRYKAMMASATSDDVVMTKAITGLPTNILRPWLEEVGVDPEVTRAGAVDVERDMGLKGEDKLPWPVPAFSAGHGVGLVDGQSTVGAVVDRLVEEFDEAGLALAARR